MHEIDLRGQVAVITGASRGLGRAFAIGLAERGASVGIVARSSTGLKEEGDLIRNAGGHALEATCDLLDENSIDAAIKHIEGQLGRIDILIKEGIEFKCNIEVGKDLTINDLEKDYDAILMSTGSTIKRSLDIPGNELSGVIQAMDFLTHNNKYVDGVLDKHLDIYNAKGKNVIVIGGGDTGSDCIGTSNRHGAKNIINFELAPKPSSKRDLKNPWPHWPFTLKSSSSHEEGVERKWSILTKKFIGDKNNNIISLQTVNVQFDVEQNKFIEIPNSEKNWDCDMVILALGFTGPENELPDKLNIELNKRGNISSNSNYQTKKNNIFTAGDCRRGQSLIVWAISEGREASYFIDKYLMGSSNLPRKDSFGDL